MCAGGEETLCVVGPAVRSRREADDGHASCDRTLDAECAVFNYDAIFGMGGDPLRRLQKNVGVRFAAFEVGGAEGVPRELIEKADHFELQRDARQAARRGDGDFGALARAHETDRSGYRFQIPAHAIKTVSPISVGEIRGQFAPVVVLDRDDAIAHAHTGVTGEGFFRRRWEPVFA